MKYIIEIKSEEEITKKQDTWQKVADTGNEKDNGAVYGYASKETTSTEERQILKIEVESINLYQVISAIMSGNKE